MAAACTKTNGGRDRDARVAGTRSVQRARVTSLKLKLSHPCDEGGDDGDPGSCGHAPICSHSSPCGSQHLTGRGGISTIRSVAKSALMLTLHGENESSHSVPLALREADSSDTTAAATDGRSEAAPHRNARTLRNLRCCVFVPACGSCLTRDMAGQTSGYHWRTG